MVREYLPFVDWMKCAGIFLIVWGHVAVGTFNRFTPPIYPKQFGVALFIFVIGFSLARETRPRWQVVFNRLFEIYLYGLAIALFLSIVMYATKGTLNLSNYEPLVLGVNVLFNNFPANPTTWYIGTYIHIIVLWAVAVRSVRVRLWMVIACVLVEIPIRATLLSAAGNYIAYMLFTNWAGTFLIGTWFGQNSRDVSESRSAVWLYLGLLLTFLTAWGIFMPARLVEPSFPFSRISAVGPIVDPLVTSACVSLLYATFAVLVFQVTRRLPAPGWVRFFSRNTLFIFIAHMPVFYAIEAPLKAWSPSFAPRAVIQLLVCFVGLALVSEIVTRAIGPKALRDWVGQNLLRSVLAPAVIAQGAAKPR